MSDEGARPSKKQRVVKTSIVDHSYTDHANSPILPNANIDNFPARLHEIVSNPAYQHIIGWMPHGRAWEVKDKKLLVGHVLNKHFSHSNFDSFNRQVNLWGFKVRSVVYQHKLNQSWPIDLQLF